MGYLQQTLVRNLLCRTYGLLGCAAHPASTPRMRRRQTNRLPSASLSPSSPSLRVPERSYASASAGGGSWNEPPPSSRPAAVPQAKQCSHSGRTDAEGRSSLRAQPLQWCEPRTLGPVTTLAPALIAETGAAPGGSTSSRGNVSESTAAEAQCCVASFGLASSGGGVQRATLPLAAGPSSAQRGETEETALPVRCGSEEGKELGSSNSARATHDDAAERLSDNYVPLLFRKDFMQSWRRPHQPLPLAQLESVVTATTVTARETPVVDWWTVDGDGGGLADDLLECTVTVPLHDAEAVGDAGLAGKDAVDGQAAPMYTVSRIPAPTSRLILDPVQWLAQSPDAPLMEQATLFEHIQPSARELTFHAATARPPNSNVDNEESSGGVVIGEDTAESNEQGQTAIHQDEEVKATATAEDTNVQSSSSQLARSESSFDSSILRAEAAPTHQHEGNSKAAPTLTALEEEEEALSSSPSSSSSPKAPTGLTGGGDSDHLYAAVSGGSPSPVQFSSKADAKADARLVYNVFTRRVARESSSAVQSLALLGINVDAVSRELTLKDPDALYSFAKKLRARQVTWPSFWSHSTLYRQLEHLLGDGRVSDPAVRVSELLAAQYRRLHHRHRVGVVAGPGDIACKSEAERESHRLSSLIQATDDKLFSLADLNEEQAKVVELVLQGCNTYIGGAAGTGKSVLLRVIRQQLLKEGLTVAVTGTTGVASTLIGGCTLHHCFGINLHGEFTRPKELAAYDVLIIDEVSMLSRGLFEALERQLRRANKVNLPFGGVQVILCGDFMQLGAIAAQPIVNAPVFRRNFAMLKLQTPVRQAQSPLFAQQLSQLRRGRVPAGLESSLNFITAPEALVSRHTTDDALRQRQQKQLHEAIGEGELAKLTATVTSDVPPPEETTYVDGAVNLLPTNEEVYEANERELAKLPGDTTVFMPQVLAPSLNGLWSPTYLLRIHDPRLIDSRRLGLELELFLGNYFKKTEAGQTWLLGSLGQRHLVVYPLFTDALALRVRLPPDFTNDAIQHFTAFMDKELDTFLASLNLGVRVREVLANAEGLQTEQDEYILDQYAQHAPMARPVSLKLGARVMLRANLAPGLVNGSLGTVVGFRRLSPEELPRYMLGNVEREDAVHAYMDFLTHEQGFAVPIVPEVDFGGGRVEPIPPTVFYVGGLPNTHHYALSIVALPLSLAYAFTVHKVQGLTLVGRVHLELSRMWPCEHLLYVAMSRVRNPEQLSISNFHSGLVKAAADCLVYDDALPTVDKVRLLPHFVPATWRRDPKRRKKELRRKELEQLASRKRKEKKERQQTQRRRLDDEIRALQMKLLAETAVEDEAPERSGP